MRPRRQSTTASWPFWLLLAAWFCANLPSTATLHACAWLKGAQHFSHSGELRQSVAALLSGKPRASKPQLGAAEATRRPLPPALPAGTGTKKTDLALATGSLRLIAFISAAVRPVSIIRAPAAPVVEVPYPPPRAATPA